MTTLSGAAYWPLTTSHWPLRVNCAPTGPKVVVSLDSLDTFISCWPASRRFTAATSNKQNSHASLLPRVFDFCLQLVAFSSPLRTSAPPLPCGWPSALGRQSAASPRLQSTGDTSALAREMTRGCSLEKRSTWDSPQSGRKDGSPRREPGERMSREIRSPRRGRKNLGQREPVRVEYPWFFACAPRWRGK